MRRSVKLPVLPILLASSVFILSWTPLSRASEKSYTGIPEFEQMKKLAGRWEGPGRKKKDIVIVEYKVTAGGRTLEEKIFAGTEKETLSVYYEKEGRLVFTYYGLFQNPFPLELRSANENAFDFLLAVGSGIKPSEPHLHEVVLTFVDAGHLIHNRIFFDEGKRDEAVILNLTRAREQAAEVREKPALPTPTPPIPSPAPPNPPTLPAASPPLPVDRPVQTPPVPPPLPAPLRTETDTVQDKPVQKKPVQIKQAAKIVDKVKAKEEKIQKANKDVKKKENPLKKAYKFIVGD